MVIIACPMPYVTFLHQGNEKRISPFYINHGVIEKGGQLEDSCRTNSRESLQVREEVKQMVDCFILDSTKVLFHP